MRNSVDTVDRDVFQAISFNQRASLELLSLLRANRACDVSIYGADLHSFLPPRRRKTERTTARPRRLVERTKRRNGHDSPAGDVTDIDCWPELELPLPLVFSFRSCFLCFIRRFWNHVFTWVSDRCNAAASSTLSGVLRYLCTSNLASKPASCWSLNT